jgi:cold shock CspA family protein
MAKRPIGKAPNAHEPRGRPATGTVATITRGRGDGFVRESGGELLYFNRRDVVDGSFNDLNISDSVAFEVIEDHVSGHRAARVAKQK